nr:nucleolar protein 58 isoform X1 [Ipomoea batatas]
MPGQKRDPPEERDPSRLFYESLYNQLPESNMAAIWMMESGLLSKDEAKEVFEKIKKKAQQQKHISPKKSVKKTTASPVPAKKTQTPSPAVSTHQRKKAAASEAKPKQSNKRKKEDDDSDDGSDDDFVLAPRNPKKQKTS